MSITKFTSEILLSATESNHVFFFDFDGTLSEIAPTPEEAELKPIAKRAIEELAKRFPVGIISGRKLEDLKKLVRVNGIFYSGNHGVEIEGPGLKFVEPNSARSVDYITSLGKEIKSNLKLYHPGINSKKYSVSIHYRTIEPAKVRLLLMELDKVISGPLRGGKIDVFHGKKVVEIKAPVDWDKGKALEMILRHLVNAGRDLDKLVPVFFGDDKTDEYGFKKVNEMNGLSVFVGKKHRKTLAKYWIGSPSELIGALAKFLFVLR